MITSRTIVARLCALLLASGLWSSVASAAAVAKLRPQDRVVFLGDSITAGALYTRFVEAFLRLRHPEWELTFVNAGIGGHTAIEGVARLERDVLRFKPTVVFVNFGMNDAGYQPGTRPAAFEANMIRLIENLQKGGVERIIWLESTPFDVRGMPAEAIAKSREAGIRRYVQFAREEGAKRGIPVIKLHDAMLEAIAFDGRQDRPGKLLPDRVHPSRAGHAVIAATILEALGEDLSPPSLEARWTSGVVWVKGAPRQGPSDWNGNAPLTLELSGMSAPVPMLTDDKAAGGSGAEAARRLARLVLRFEGLPPGRAYAFSSGGVSLGTYTGAQLAKGVDLMTAAGRPKLGAKGDVMCGLTKGLPFHNDYACAQGLIEGRDMITGTARSDRLRALPDLVPERKAGFSQLFEDWYDEYARYFSARIKASLDVPHAVVMTPGRAPAAKR